MAVPVARGVWGHAPPPGNDFSEVALRPILGLLTHRTQEATLVARKVKLTVYHETKMLSETQG